MGLALLCTLQRRGPLRSEALLPLANAALPALAVPVRLALLESLRLLVRCGYVLRERGGGSHCGGPSYTLSPLAHEQLQRVLAARALPPEPPSARPTTPELLPPPHACPLASASASTSAELARPSLDEECRLPPAAAAAATALANGPKEAGLSTASSQDVSPARRAAAGATAGAAARAERAGSVSGAPAKYRIKRRPRGDSGDGNSAAHGEGEEAGRGGTVASGLATSRLRD